MVDGMKCTTYAKPMEIKGEYLDMGVFRRKKITGVLKS